jgi:ammonia channel protein AmtB
VTVVRIGVSVVLLAIGTFALAVGWWTFFSEGAEEHRAAATVSVVVGILALAAALGLVLLSVRKLGSPGR